MDFSLPFPPPNPVSSSPSATSLRYFFFFFAFYSHFSPSEFAFGVKQNAFFTIPRGEFIIFFSFFFWNSLVFHLIEILGRVNDSFLFSFFFFCLGGRAESIKMIPFGFFVFGFRNSLIPSFRIRSFMIYNPGLGTDYY